MTDSSVTASLFAGEHLHAFGVLFAGLLATACVTDLRSRRIPNGLVVVLAVSGLAFSMVAQPGFSGVVRALGGLVTGFALWIVFYALRVLGAGDVKLAAAMGAWFGPAGIWRASLVAALAGGVIATGILLYERRLRRVSERVALAASLRSMTPVEMSKDETSSQSGRRVQMPYGVALAIGAGLSAWVPGLLA